MKVGESMSSKQEFEIIDNFLPLNVFNDLQDLVMGSEFPYFFITPVNDRQDDSDISSCFFHLLFDIRNDDYVQTAYYKLFAPIFKEKLQIKSLVRMKVGLYPRTNVLEEYAMHIDQQWEHKGAIFSFNTCDGATILEDGTRIDSVANRMLLFNSHLPHASTSCTNATARVNLNINYF